MFLQDLSKREVERIEELGTPREFPSEAVILQENQPGDSFHMIVEGRAEVRKLVCGGRYQRMSQFGPCDFIGEIGFFGASVRSATVVAATYCRTLEFGAAAFRGLLERYPRIGLKVYRGMASDLASRLHGTDQRLADTVLWGIRRGSSPPSAREPINIPHVPLATLKLSPA